MILGSIGTPPCSAHPAGADCIAADSGSHTHRRRRLRARRHAARRASATAPTAASPTRCPLRAQDLEQLEREDPADQQGRHGAGRQPVLRRHELDPLEGLALRRAQSVPVRRPTRRRARSGSATSAGTRGKRSTTGSQGANYGWPCYEGNGRQPGVPVAFAAVPAAHRRRGHAPYYTYDHSVGDGGDRRAVLHRQRCTRSSTGATTSSPTTRATSSGASCSTPSTTRSASTTVRHRRRGAGVARGRPRRDDLLPVVHDRADPPDPVQRARRRGVGDPDVRLLAAHGGVLERRLDRIRAAGR